MNAVFASRWKALLWSAGVLLTAYCTVPSSEPGDEPTSIYRAPPKPAGDDAPHFDSERDLRRLQELQRKQP